MEAEKKPKRPRISSASTAAASDNNEGDRYEKVNYPGDGERPQAQRSYNNDRQGGYQRPYGGYQQRNSGYNRNNNYSNHYDRPSYGNHNSYQQQSAQAAEGDSDKSETSTESGYQAQQGGYQPRQGGYQPRQGAYQPRQGG